MKLTVTTSLVSSYGYGDTPFSLPAPSSPSFRHPSIPPFPLSFLPSLLVSSPCSLPSQLLLPPFPYPACRNACLPGCRSSCLPRCLPTCLTPFHLPVCLPTFLPAFHSCTLHAPPYRAPPATPPPPPSPLLSPFCCCFFFFFENCVNEKVPDRQPCVGVWSNVV